METVTVTGAPGPDRMGASTASAVPEPAIADPLNRARRLHEQTCQALDRLNRIATRIVHGVETLPSQPQPAGERPRRAGLVGSFEDVNDDNESNLTRLNELIEVIGSHV